jgi:hypothetical protein
MREGLVEFHRFGRAGAPGWEEEERGRRGEEEKRRGEEEKSPRRRVPASPRPLGIGQ